MITCLPYTWAWNRALLSSSNPLSHNVGPNLIPYQIADWEGPKARGKHSKYAAFRQLLSLFFYARKPATEKVPCSSFLLFALILAPKCFWPKMYCFCLHFLSKWIDLEVPNQTTLQTINWLVVWNINFIFPYIGNNHPNWLSYFSEGWPNHQPVNLSTPFFFQSISLPRPGTDKVQPFTPSKITPWHGQRQRSLNKLLLKWC